MFPSTRIASKLNKRKVSTRTRRLSIVSAFVGAFMRSRQFYCRETTPSLLSINRSAKEACRRPSRLLASSKCRSSNRMWPQSIRMNSDGHDRVSGWILHFSVQLLHGCLNKELWNSSRCCILTNTEDEALPAWTDANVSQKNLSLALFRIHCIVACFQSQ